jgi:hypothetical protein
LQTWGQVQTPAASKKEKKNIIQYSWVNDYNMKQSGNCLPNLFSKSLRLFPH